MGIKEKNKNILTRFFNHIGFGRFIRKYGKRMPIDLKRK
nr:MAG TPA: hypothetical protein [Caudoviricetes sp.]